jgi:thioredoxin reductase
MRLTSAAGFQHDLVVVGAGPVGIAALFHAAQAGLDAIGIEAGDGPLSSVRGFPEELIFLSPSVHFEVAGLPLDCKDAHQLTREELLHYFSRVLAWSRTRVECHQRCLALQPVPGGVELVVKGPRGMAVISARDVLITAWHAPRPVPAEYRDPTGVVSTFQGLSNPASLDHAKCVAIIGGGISAHEQAVSLMMRGHRVALVSRQRFLSAFRQPDFVKLLTATASALYQEASEVVVSAEGLSARTPAGPLRVDCTAVVTCLGLAPSTSTLDMLVRARALTSAEAKALQVALTPDQIFRTGTVHDLQAAMDRAAAGWPDLRELLFEGRNHIRGAGSALHVGGQDAGIRTSIETARLAVQAIVKPGSAPIGEGTLPQALIAWISQPPSVVPEFDTVASIRPIAVRAWTRTSMPAGQEDNRAVVLERPRDLPLKYLLGGASQDDVVLALLPLCDGLSPVKALAKELGVRTPKQKKLFTRLLCSLFRNNALTWLPPATTSVALPSLLPARCLASKPDRETANP